MAAPKRTKIQREKDLVVIAELYLSGYRQIDIAGKLGLDQSQISYDLKELQKRWENTAIRNLDEAKSRELERIDNLEREYWESWRKSQKPAGYKTVDRERIILDEENKLHKGVVGLTITAPGEGQEGELVKTSVRTEKRVGDPKYLQGVQWCIERRCKILGIDAPTKISQTDPSGENELTVRIEYVNAQGVAGDTDASNGNS